eukprot:scaffold533244_cov31-Prasinocladus_malaysianus.AAC.1
MDGLRHQLHTAFKSTAERVLPVLSRSAFREKGVSCTPAPRLPIQSLSSTLCCRLRSNSTSAFVS